MKYKDLLENTIRFEYSDQTYRIDLLTNSTLRWTREKGQNIGEGDEEKYVASQLSDDLVMITWIEKGGPGLSNVLDFKT